MSSSTFEVIETENETEKDLSFGLEACEENDIGLSAQVDGEIQKDHTYTKDPDGTHDEDADDSKQESDKKEAHPEKQQKNPKGQKNSKKANPKNSKVKKDASPKKEAKETPSRRSKARKEVLSEESNKSEDGGKGEKSDEKNNSDESKPLRRGKKRKVEEKENVIDRSIVEEVQNIKEGEPVAAEDSESPTKKKKATPEKPKSKKSQKNTPVAEEGESNQNMPKGWVRKVVVRKSGKTAGQVDVYIYSPDGIKFRSRPDVAAYLARTKSNLKLEDFNFSKKVISEDSVPKSTPKKEKSPVKPKSTPEKKKPKESPTLKKGQKIVVKLNFSPKGKKAKLVRHVKTNKGSPKKAAASSKAKKK